MMVEFLDDLMLTANNGLDHTDDLPPHSTSRPRQPAVSYSNLQYEPGKLQ